MHASANITLMASALLAPTQVLAFTAFKSTEPWLVDYVTLDLHEAMRQVRHTVRGDAAALRCLLSFSTLPCLSPPACCWCLFLPSQAGFEAPQQLSNSPRHRTVVAQKPAAA